MTDDDHNGLRRRLEELRSRLDLVFANDTAAPGTPPSDRPRSCGHCAVVAILVRDLIGGEYVSTAIGGLSHWFNRVVNDGVWIDVDLTGDQFGQAAVGIGSPNELWPNTRSRSAFDINVATTKRYVTLRYRLSMCHDQASTP